MWQALTMPHLKILRNVFIQIILLLSLIAITGHLISNYQERLALRNEISIIRSSLHNLKYTINDIGTTYDNLYNDIRSFVTGENTKLPIDVKYFKITQNRATDNLKSNKLFLLDYFNDVNKDKIKRFIYLPQGVNNATKMTRNLKATGLGSEPITLFHQCSIKRECKKMYQSKSNIHKGYKNFKSCSCSYSY